MRREREREMIFELGEVDEVGGEEEEEDEVWPTNQASDGQLV